MDTTIIERWKLCICASFIGCIILVLCLNQSRNSANLSALQNPAISITSFNQFPTPSIEFSAASTLIVFRPKAVNHNEDRCNIFDGQWVYDSRARPFYEGPQCPFLSDQVSCRRNGRSDTNYEKWSWRAKGCEIPRFNATDMLERLRGKRVIIVGDSLNRNQWESLACLLYSAVPPSRAYVETRSSVYKVFRAKDYNCSVEFYWSPFLVQLDVKKENGTRVLRLDKLSGSARRWRGADIMVFNTGHWWAHQGKLRAWDLFQYRGKLVEEMEIESALDIAMKTWARWIRRKLDRNKTRVFFRSISPSHTGKQCYNETQPILDESDAASFPKSLTQIIEGTIKAMKNPVRYLNITNLSQYRRDAHPSIYSRKQEERQQLKEFHPDCSHWCLPGLPDTWNGLLYASLVFDTSGHISDS